MEAILAWIKNFFLAFWESLKALLGEFVVWILTPIYNVLKSFFLWLWDLILTFVSWILNALPFDEDLFDISFIWDAIPDTLLWMLNELEFDKGFLILVTAIGIRLLLNLIPTWATRI